MRPEGGVPRQTRPRQRPQLLYSRDRGGRASPPAPGARGQIGTLVLQVSASPPPRLFLLGGTGWRPPIQPGRRRRRRRQRQQVNRVPKAPARLRGARRGSATGRGREQAPSPPAHARSGRRSRTLERGGRRVIHCLAELGSEPGVPPGASATRTHTWASSLRSQTGRMLFFGWRAHREV